MWWLHSPIPATTSATRATWGTAWISRIARAKCGGCWTICYRRGPGAAPSTPQKLESTDSRWAGLPRLWSSEGLPIWPKSRAFAPVILRRQSVSSSGKITATSSHPRRLLLRIGRTTENPAAVVAASAASLAFGTNGLRGVLVPVQLWRASNDQQAPDAWNSQLVCEGLPVRPEEHVVANAGHMVFHLCSETLRQSVGWMCQEAPGFDRVSPRVQPCRSHIPSRSAAITAHSRTRSEHFHLF